MNIKALVAQKWFIPAAVVAAVVVVGVAMSGSSERGAVDYDGDGEVRVKTDDGEWSTGGKVPSDWPSDVAIYGGAKVLYSASTNPETGTAGSYVALQSSDSAAKVAAYYKSELAAKGWTISNTADVNGGLYLGATKDDRELSLAVTPGEDGSSSIIIGVAKK